MKLSAQRQGELYIIFGTLLWGIFPIFAQLSYSSVSPFTSLTVSSLFAALFFGLILTIRHRWHELKNTKALIYSLWATLFVAVLYYLFYFMSLRYSSVGNISILALSEAFFSFLLFHVWHKEFIPKEHIYGAILILVGAIVVLLPSIKSFHIGDILILLGAAIVPFGNFFVQKARKLINTETIMFVRGVVGALAIFLLSFLFHASSSANEIYSSLPYLIVNGMFILGLSSMLWVEGIHRISVTKANALSALGPLVTLFFAWIILKTSPTYSQLIAFIPMFFGVIMISKKVPI